MVRTGPGMDAAVLHVMRRIAAALLLSIAAAACAAPEDDDSASTTGALREDPAKEPQVIRVPIRFTRNDVADVGSAFSVSWLPFTDVHKTTIDGFTWGYFTPDTAKGISKWYAPDLPGAGYVTAWFKVEVPYSTEGNLAYELARVKLESEFIKTDFAWRNTTTYSPLRVRAGSDQPCLSVTMQGSLDGKFRAMSLPYTDQDFTERDWKVDDVDATGKTIKKIVVGTFAFTAAGWPENVEGKTNISGGVAAGSAFLMVDKSDGQGSSSSARVFVNLVENVDGKVSLGASFSTNAGILNERDTKKFDDAAAAYKAKYDAEVQRGIDAFASAAAAPVFLP